MIIGICDDEESQLSYIDSLICTWAAKKRVQCEVEKFVSAENLLFECSENMILDVLILDIMMGKMNGMELAKKIRETDGKIKLIFLTGIKDYVFEGYEVGAVRYLLKPLKEEMLFQALDGINDEMKNSSKSYYIFNYQGEQRKILYDDILAVEVEGHYIKIITANMTFEIKESLSSWKDALVTSKEKSFCQVHRSFMVNLKSVEVIKRTECILNDGIVIPISRNCYQALNEAFIEYYKE